MAASSVLQPQSLGKAEIDFQDVARCDTSIKVIAFFTPPHHSSRTSKNIRSGLSEDHFHDISSSSTRCRDTFTYRRYKSLQNPTLGNDDSSCPSPMRLDVKTVQRSSARGVKDLLAKADILCREHRQRPERNSAVPPPIEEFLILANWAKDSYYAVVMIKNGSVPITVSAMHTFLSHPEFLVVCCQMLKSFCEHGECYQKAVKTSAGVGDMLDNLRNHPGSSIVQYAACEAQESVTSKKRKIIF